MTISKISHLTGLTSDTLRYYEKIGLITNVPRNKSGIREYNDANIKRIEFVKCLRSAGMPVDSLLEYFRLLDEGVHTANKRKDLLIKQNQLIDIKIQEFMETKKKLVNKIANYEKIISKENELARLETKDAV